MRESPSARRVSLRPLSLWLTSALITWAAPTVLAAEPDDRTLALVGTCVACHGADGIGKAAQYPNLRGQKAPYIEKQMKAFRSGERKDSNMEPLSQPLSDEDIAVLAAYFAGLDEARSAVGETP